MPKLRDQMGNWIMEYRCRRGHEWRSSAPTKVTPRIDAVAFRASPDELLATSGPICPYCYTDFVREQFGAVAGEGDHAVSPMLIAGLALGDLLFWEAFPMQVTAIERDPDRVRISPRIQHGEGRWYTPAEFAAASFQPPTPEQSEWYGRYPSPVKKEWK